VILLVGTLKKVKLQKTTAENTTAINICNNLTGTKRKTAVTIIAAIITTVAMTPYPFL
jgi:hypothetical protein